MQHLWSAIKQSVILKQGMLVHSPILSSLQERWFLCFLGCRHMYHSNAAEEIRPSPFRCVAPSVFNTVLMLSTLPGHVFGQQCTCAHISSHPQTKLPSLNHQEFTALGKAWVTYHANPTQSHISSSVLDAATWSSQIYVHAINHRTSEPAGALVYISLWDPTRGKLSVLEHDVIFMRREGWESHKAP